MKLAPQKQRCISFVGSIFQLVDGESALFSGRVAKILSLITAISSLLLANKCLHVLILTWAATSKGNLYTTMEMAGIAIELKPCASAAVIMF